MSNNNFFNGLKQIGRNNLEAWMKYMENFIPTFTTQVIDALAVEKLLAQGMPKMSLQLVGADLNALTDKMYYAVTNPINTPLDVTSTKCFVLVMGERVSDANPNPEVFQLLYTFEPQVALHYRYGTIGSINAGLVPWNNYRNLLKGDQGLSAYEVWKLENPAGTLQDYYAFNKGEKGDEGDKGDKGDEGLNAYQVWLMSNPDKSQQDFLEYLVGPMGKSIYEVWLENNPSGTFAQFVEAYKGYTGWSPILATEVDGARVLIKVLDWEGDAPTVKPDTGDYICPDGYTSNKALATDFRGLIGPQGDNGDKGDPGPRGFRGDDGKSAYQFWLEQGNTGSIQDFIASFGNGIAVVPPKVYWGTTITGDKSLSSSDIGLSFLITADAIIEMPDWDSIDSGWYVHLYPYDFGKKSGLDLTVTTKAGQTIRGELGKLQGDATVIRSPVVGQFIIYGEVKYVQREDLQNLVNQVNAMDWTDYWYPNWFPVVQVALANAQATLANPNASNLDINNKFNALNSVTQSLGIRVTLPCPYNFNNGDWDASKPYKSMAVADVGGSVGAKVTFVQDKGATLAAAHAQQPAVAMTTVNQVLSNPALIPASFADGTAVFSKFNEVPRSKVGETSIGFEFASSAPNLYNSSIILRGEVFDKNDDRFVLEAEVGTVYESSTVKLLTAIRAIKYTNGVEVGRDVKVTKTNQTYSSGNFVYGFWYNPVTKKIGFKSVQTTLADFDAFDTNTVSSGLFSTAFSKIDSFGLAVLTSEKKSGSTDLTLEFRRRLPAWTLDFPESVKDTCGLRLLKANWVEPARAATASATTSDFKIKSTVNIVELPSWVEPARTASASAETSDFKVKTVTSINETNWTEAARTASASAATSNFKIVTTAV